MVAIRHLEFVGRILRPHTKSTWGLYHCGKFGWNRCSGFDFGMLGNVADVITRAKFQVNRFSGFGVLTPAKSALLHRFIGWSLL